MNLLHALHHRASTGQLKKAQAFTQAAARPAALKKLWDIMMLRSHRSLNLRLSRVCSADDISGKTSRPAHGPYLTRGVLGTEALEGHSADRISQSRSSLP